MALDSVRLRTGTSTFGGSRVAVGDTRVPVDHLADFDDGGLLLRGLLEQRHLGVPAAVGESALDHDGGLRLCHSVLDALWPHRRPAEQRGEPPVKFILRGRAQMDLELRVEHDDVDVGGACLVVVGALDVAAAQIGDQGAGVGRVALGLVDETAGLVVDEAVRQRPGVGLTAAEGHDALHLAARGAHESLEALDIGGRHGRLPRLGRQAGVGIGGLGRGGARGRELLGQTAAGGGARGAGRGLRGRGDGGDVADGGDDRLLEAVEGAGGGREGAGGALEGARGGLEGAGRARDGADAMAARGKQRRRRAVAGAALLEGAGARAGRVARGPVVVVAGGAGDEGARVGGARGLPGGRARAAGRREAVRSEAVVCCRRLLRRDGADGGGLALVAQSPAARGSLGGLGGTHLPPAAALVHGCGGEGSPGGPLGCVRYSLTRGSGGCRGLESSRCRCAWRSSRALRVRCGPRWRIAGPVV